MSAASVTIFHSNLQTLVSLESSHCTTEALASGWIGSSQLIATKYLGAARLKFNLFGTKSDKCQEQQGICDYWVLVLQVDDLQRWKEVYLKWEFLNICLETFIYRYLKAPLQKMSFFVSKIWSIQKIRFQKHQTFEQLLLWSQLSAQLLCFGAMDFVVPSAGRCASLQDANLILQARPWSNKITPAMRETRESPLRLKKFYQQFIVDIIYVDPLHA